VAWLLKDSCELLYSIAIIECAMKGEVEPLIPLKKPYNVLVQQVFLFLLRHARTSRRELAESVFSHSAFTGIRPENLDRIVAYLIERGYLTPDGEMVMLGEAAEREFGRSNWKDLYSMISGGGEYRAVTPDGEMVGKLDARFVNSLNNVEISLGGQGWSLVKCDEEHKLVVVVPSSSVTSGIFWTGGESGYSLLVCRQVQVLRARGGSVLPISDDDQEILFKAISRIPEGVGSTGLYIRERQDERGGITVYSFNGTRFNRILTLLLQYRLGSKVQVRYNDFVIKLFRLGKEGAAERVATAVRDIQVMGEEEMESVIPLPPSEGWKFGMAIPQSSFREMAISDHYHIAEFRESFKIMILTVLQSPTPAPVQDPG
jgi:ATP-dependent Lhr-like helicase